ncbi:MAG: hypothetical protein ACRCU2_22410 [Planktothrix sp.]
MNLTYGLNNARDLLKKLERDANKLEDEVTSDNMFNFIVTAYHIKDWIKNDDNNTQDIRDKARDLPASEKIINRCQDIANASKHFTLNRDGQRFQITSEVTSEQGFGVGRYSKGGFGKGEEEIIIKSLPTSDDPEGEEFNILDFKREVVKFWHKFFEENGL